MKCPTRSKAIGGIGLGVVCMIRGLMTYDHSVLGSVSQYRAPGASAAKRYRSSVAKAVRAQFNWMPYGVSVALKTTGLSSVAVLDIAACAKATLMLLF